MLSRADNSFSFAIVAALVLFFIGGLYNFKRVERNIVDIA